MTRALAVPRSGRSSRRALVLAALLASAAAPALAQAPAGGRVLSGSAAIAQSAGHTTITQSSERAVIRWSGFDVGKTHRVDFDQPGRSSATLNRVISMRGSVIEGAIHAPGTVIIQNSAGVLFTGTARVDTGGLVATSQWVDSDPFMTTGHLGIGGEGDRDAPVVNEGEITVRNAGLAALVGAKVRNSGVIVADRGTVALTSGRRTTIDLGGDGVARIAVFGNAATGSKIENSGVIDVGEGRVVITAGDAARALDNVINTTGVIRATSGTGAGGGVRLVGQGTGRVRIAGAIEARGATRGGEISATGATLAVEGGGTLDARGGIDGGAILLGDLGPLRRPDSLVLDRTARLLADGAAGAGGQIVALSDGAAEIEATLSALGGGGGGSVRTIAPDLGIGEAASVSVGPGGDWLVGTTNARLATGSSTPRYAIDRLAIIEALNGGGDVAVAATEDVVVARELAWSGTGDLDLRADRDATIGAAVTSGGTGDFTATAAREFRLGASVAATGVGDVALTAETGDLLVVGAEVEVATNSGALDFDATEGSVLLIPVGALEVASASGDITLNAGTAIQIWGTMTGGAALRATAPEIGIAAAEVTARGGLSMVAIDRITVDGGTVAALGGGALEMQAPTQVWNGAVASGTGAADGGDVLLSGAISAGVAPTFGLRPGASFALLATAPGGAASSYASPLGFAVSTSGRGAIAIGAPVTAASVALTSEEGVALGAGARIEGTGPGDAVVLAAGRSLDNAAGADALTASAGRWLLYLDDFASLTGVKPASGTPDLYGRTFADAPPATLAGFAGDRVIWGEAPVLTITAGSGERVYGGAATSLGYTLAGFRAGDGAETALDGAPVVTSAGNALGADAGRYATTAEATASAQGYRLAFVGGALEVTPAPLTVTAFGTRTYGAATASYAPRVAGLVAGDTAADLGGELDFTTPATRTSGVGSYALLGAGLRSGNYTIGYETGALTITPAQLTVAVDNVSRRFDTPNPGFTATYSGFVLGQGPGDLNGALAFATDATRTSPAGNYAVTASGLASGNYLFNYVPGTLRVTPPTANLAAQVRRFGRGSRPFTPGDASFRTTSAEAPPAIDNPFELTYSLGEVGRLTARGAQGFTPASGGAPADTQGFVPAAGGDGGAAGGGAAAGGCSGSVNTGDTGVCALETQPESFWQTTGGTL
mgnify:CR=1 FL=1